VGITSGYYLFNAAPYALTLLIMMLSSSANRTSVDQPAELSAAR
jgi:simple sugar transport system permease protein